MLFVLDYVFHNATLRYGSCGKKTLLGLDKANHLYAYCNVSSQTIPTQASRPVEVEKDTGPSELVKLDLLGLAACGPGRDYNMPTGGSN